MSGKSAQNWMDSVGVQWARTWSSETNQSLFETLCAMQSSHEELWSAGAGKLEGIRHRNELKWPESENYCDGGVLVLCKDVLRKDLFIVGDIHGDLDSLDKAIKISGVLEGKCTLLFLGDYGDRGTATLGVWATVAALKNTCPGNVFLMRGNHEELIEVRTSRAESGEALVAPWFVPGNGGDAESYFALGHILPGQNPSNGWPSNLTNVEELFRFLPSVVLLPDDGTLVVHGGISPRWSERDGSKFTPEQKQALNVAGLTDLRKPPVQRAIRWSRPLEKDDVDEAWRNPRAPVCSVADFLAWKELFGICRLIHGHTHPADGFESGWNGQRFVVNSNKITGEIPVILKRETDGKFVPVQLM